MVEYKIMLQPLKLCYLPFCLAVTSDVLPQPETQMV